jgi:quercetin dioxygenase-like cupin family protein
MGRAVTRSDGVAAIPVESVDPIDLPGGSWSRIMLSGTSVGAGTAFGVSSFAPGTTTALMTHESEELAYVVSGTGHLQMEDDVVPYTAGTALYIPAHVWHAVVNTGNEPVVMVFAFAHPEYPPTERRSVDA